MTTTQAICEEKYTPFKERWSKRRTTKESLTPEIVINFVSTHLGLDVDEVLGPRRYGELAFCRAVISKILYKHTKITQDQLGRILNRDRTSVTYNIITLTAWIDIYPEIRQQFEEIEKMILAL